jgi:acyl homoserine lactone synthase
MTAIDLPKLVVIKILASSSNSRRICQKERRTLHFVSGVSSNLKPDLISGMARYRHEVFVKKLGWQLQSENGLEYDQFDRDDTVYVVARNDAQKIIGTARLLPTTQPYLLAEIFPQLLNGLAAPASADIWELSRFAAVDFNANATSAMGQFSSKNAIDLLRESLLCASTLGARRVITVSPIGVERLLRKAGFQAHRAGPPVIIDGHSIFACWIDLKFEAALSSVSIRTNQIRQNVPPCHWAMVPDAVTQPCSRIMQACVRSLRQVTIPYLIPLLDSLVQMLPRLRWLPALVILL